MCVCVFVCVLIHFIFSFNCIDGSSIAAAPAALSAYNSAYGLSSSYYSSPKVALAPAVSKVIAAPAVATYGVAPTISSYAAPVPSISATYSSAPAVSSYYSANKLAYSTPSLTTSYVAAAAPPPQIQQVSYATAAPPLQSISQYVSPAYSTAYGSSYGLAKAAYSATPAAKYVSTAYTNPAAITSSYVAANKFAYTGPNVATQYAASYSPSISPSYISAPIAKQVSYAANPLLSGGAAYVSGYKSGAAYVSPASVATTSTLGGAGIIKTAGYTSSLG